MFLIPQACKSAEKFTLELKWFISLHDITVGEGGEDVREASPPNLVGLKTQAATLRDQIRRIEEKVRIKIYLLFYLF